MQGAFLEAEPDVRVEFTGFFEGVFVEIENDELTAGAKNAMRLVDRGLWMLSVMQCLTKNREVDRLVGERDGLDIAQPVSEIEETVFLREFGADFHHARGIVDTPDGAGAMGEELGNQTLAGTEVGDVDRGGEAQGEVTDGFP